MRTKFRGLTTRETALIKGPSGWGEFAPFLEYGGAEATPWLASALEAAFEAKAPVLRSQIAINGTIPAVDEIGEIEKLVAAYPGAKVFKVKVGWDLNSDLARIRAVRKFAPSAKLRVDVNGSWSVDVALSNIHALHDELGELLEYVEQPVATLEELRTLKSQLAGAVKIAGDEVLRKARDPHAIDLAGAIDILMLKVAPLGGIKRSLELAAHHKLPVVVSSALESAVGITYGLRLAAALPELEYAAGLGTGALFSEDLVTLPIVSGAISVSNVELDEDRIAYFAAPAERLEWWRNRVREVWELAR
jgi:O-succinylbenzoate synthase